MMPRPGQLVAVGKAASVQFGGGRSLLFRVTKIHPWLTYHGWVWLGGYVLTAHGIATARRDIFVQIDGIRSA